MEENNNRELQKSNTIHINIKENSVLNIKEEFLSDLKTRPAIDTNLRLGCVMNTNFLGEEDFKYRVYQCFSCPGKLENLCEFCFNICHKDHNSHLKGVIQLDKEVSISKVMCDCALGNHDFNIGNLSRKSSEDYENRTSKCPINDVIASIDPKYYFYDTLKNTYLCFYCSEFCINDLNDDENNDINEVNDSTSNRNEDNRNKNESYKNLNKDNTHDKLNKISRDNKDNKDNSIVNFSLNNKYYRSKNSNSPCY